MTYYAHLDLLGEPFAPTSDPRFFHRTAALSGILDSMEIAVLLRRGVCVCLGGSGMGKTMLCQALSQVLRKNEHVVVLQAQGPLTGSHAQFAQVLHHCVLGREPAPGTDLGDVIRAVQQGVRRKAATGDGVNQVLLVDEGQRLTPQCLEILRELLNLEAEDGKLLQIVIFANDSFSKTLARHAAFADRIYEIFRLPRFRREDTVDLLTHRLRAAGATRELFSRKAMHRIHAASGGVPRKAVLLAHKVVLRLVDRNISQAGPALVRATARKQGLVKPVFSRAGLSLIALFSLLTVFAAFGLEPLLDRLRPADAPEALQLGAQPPANASGRPFKARIDSSAQNHPLPQPLSGESSEKQAVNASVSVDNGDASAGIADDGEIADTEATPDAVDGPVSPDASEAPEVSGRPGIKDVSGPGDRNISSTLSEREVAQDVGQKPLEQGGDPALPAEQGPTSQAVPDPRPKSDALEPDGRRYVVQVGAFSTRKQAESLLKSYASRFPKAGVMHREYKGRGYYVAYVARSGRISQAFDLVKTLLSEEGVRAYVIDVTQDDYLPLKEAPED